MIAFFKRQIKDLKIFIQRRKTSRDKQETDDPDDEDRHPGTISLTDGEHDKPSVIKKKLVNTVLIGGVLILGVAWYYNTDNKKTEHTAVQSINESAADPAAAGRRNRTPGTYEELFGANQQAKQGQRITQGNNPRAGTQGNNSIPANSAAMSAYQNRQSVAPSVPAQSYSAPYVLPSAALYNQPPAVSPTNAAPSVEDQAAREIEDRYKSAIAFAVGKVTGNQSQAGNTTNAGGVAGNGDTRAQTLGYAAPNAQTLQVGTLIPVMLFSGINTDAAGQVTAQVESDIYDSATGTNLLIPAGSQIIGTYEAGKASNSGRVSVTFSTIVLPDGGAYSVGSSLIAVDSAGYSGISGKVNRHTGQVLSGGVLSSALAALGSYASGNTSTSANTYTGGQLAMQGAMANLMNSASKLFEKNSNVAATVTVDPGYEFNAYVTQPIAFNL